MKTFARFLLVGTMLLARCAWAAEASPVEFAKSVVSERGSQTFATVNYPDRNLIVEFRELRNYGDSALNLKTSSISEIASAERQLKALDCTP